MGSLSSCWILLCQRLVGCSRISRGQGCEAVCYLRRRHPELSGTVFHSPASGSSPSVSAQGFLSTSQQPRGASLRRSANKLTYGLYSAGISDAQKREIVEGIRLPVG